MKMILLVFLLLVMDGRAELVMTVTPEVVEPDFTPLFSLNCALLENEEAKVFNISISRQTAAQSLRQQYRPRETLAYIQGLTPTAPIPAPGFERLTLLGQITSFETELGSYLKILWPTPRVEDLGTYFCDAIVVGETGQMMPLTAQISVTTADPLTDRLLAALNNLEKRLDGFNETLLDIQAQIDNITAEEREDEARDREEDKEKDTETETDTDTDRERDRDWTGWTKEETTEEPSTDGTEEALAKLVDAVTDISSKLESFNSSLASLESKISDLEEDDAENETDPVRGRTDLIVAYFFAGNSTYFLFQSNWNTDSYRAEVVCESKKLYLAEVNDEEELTAISEELTSYVPEEGMVLVAGRLKAGRRAWTYQRSGERVTYLTTELGTMRSLRNSQCLALRNEQGFLEFTAVPCSDDREAYYFLCEDEE